MRIKYYLVPITIFILIFSTGVRKLVHAQSSSFTFTATGDYGGSSNAAAVLTITNPQTSGAAFNIVLGDLSYGSIKPESAWCDFVKSKVGSNFPFELIAGNHEDDTPSGYNIDNFKLCLPHRLGNLVGDYAKEYYFDYPTPALARFILISPNLMFTSGGTYSYSKGSNRYNWVSQAIDGAKAAGIPWVIVGMHQNCITMGVKSCSIGADLFNLLVEKKVDLILQGHDHDYQRSKQLALGSSCPAITTGSYNSNCVVDHGTDGVYTKGAGSVLIINGTAGAGLYNINTGDREAGYFVKWMGNNINPRHGISKVTVSPNRMDISFVGATSGTFTDSFIISGGAIQATPTSSQGSITPTPTFPLNCPTKNQGDANCDGKIDGIDYSIWLNSQCRPIPSQTCTNTRADFNKDGKVDDVDYNIWYVNREGSVSPSPISSPTPTIFTSIPTPATGELDIAVCDPAHGPFTRNITNPFFPLPQGSVRVLAGAGFKVKISVLNQTEVVAGITTQVIEEREWENGNLAELSRNFFVQSPNGTVCYYGEDVDIYSNGQITGHSGAWRAGVGGNKPGIIMPASPAVGQKYQQEVAPGVAMDRAEHISLVNDVLLVQETPPSTKRYQRGVGLIFDDGAVLTQY